MMMASAELNTQLAALGQEVPEFTTDAKKSPLGGQPQLATRCNVKDEVGQLGSKMKMKV